MTRKADRTTEPYTADRQPSLLTKRDRRYLLGDQDIEPSSDYEREVRALIRKRIWHGMLDLTLIQRLDERDLRWIFDPEDIGEEAEEIRQRALRELVRFPYHYGHKNTENSRSEQFEEYLEYAARYAVPEDEDRNVLTITEPSASVEIEYHREIDLDALAEKLDEHIGRKSSDHGSAMYVIADDFSFDELEFLMYCCYRGDGGDWPDHLVQWIVMVAGYKLQREQFSDDLRRVDISEQMPFTFEVYNDVIRDRWERTRHGGDSESSDGGEE